MNEIVSALRSLLAYNIVSFTYRKVNGEIRHAKGTRNLDLARNTTGEYIPNPKGAEQPNSYYDVQSNGWRSYKPENLISIDGVYDASGFYSKVHPTEKDELPKREIPIVEMPKHYDDDPIDLGFIGKPTDGGDLRKPDINKIIGGLFGGTPPTGGKSLGRAVPKPVDHSSFGGKVGSPVATEKGIELPVGGVPVEDFAKMVAHYVVEEIVERLAR